MSRDPAKINQKAPIFGDRRTKRNRDRSTRERTAREEQTGVDLTPYAGVEPCDLCGQPDCSLCEDDYDPDVCGFCGDSVEQCAEIRSRDDY